MKELVAKKTNARIKKFVKENLFSKIKFINNERELKYDFPYFGVAIMDDMEINENLGMREEWWDLYKGSARSALQEKRASVTGMIKLTIKGKWND
jgi:hypothetical protein